MSTSTHNIGGPWSLVIRRYEPLDHSAVVDLHHLGLNQDGANAGPGPWDDDLDEITRHYIESGGEFLVGVVDGQLVAMGAIRPVDSQRGELKRMRVHPRYQGRGFGQLILTYLEDRARVLGFTNLVLDTTIRQLKAQALYLKNGYIETHRSLQNDQDLIFLRKDLT